MVPEAVDEYADRVIDGKAGDVGLPAAAITESAGKVTDGTGAPDPKPQKFSRFMFLRTFS